MRYLQTPALTKVLMTRSLVLYDELEVATAAVKHTLILAIERDHEWSQFLRAVVVDLPSVSLMLILLGTMVAA